MSSQRNNAEGDKCQAEFLESCRTTLWVSDGIFFFVLYTYDYIRIMHSIVGIKKL